MNCMAYELSLIFVLIINWKWIACEYCRLFTVLCFLFLVILSVFCYLCLMFGPQKVSTQYQVSIIWNMYQYHDTILFMYQVSVSWYFFLHGININIMIQFKSIIHNTAPRVNKSSGRPCCSRGDAQHCFTSTTQSLSCWRRPILIYRVRQKSNPLGKIRYLWNYSRFFHQIYSIYRWGFRPHILQILLK